MVLRLYVSLYSKFVLYFKCAVCARCWQKWWARIKINKYVSRVCVSVYSSRFLLMHMVFGNKNKNQLHEDEEKASLLSTLHNKQ